MEVTFTKEETIKLIEEYYKKLEDRDVSASITSKKGSIGLREEEGCITTFIVAEKMEIVGLKKEIKENISNDQLITLLKALFDLYEFTLTNVTINDGINSRWEGYGYNEHEVKYAYFNGITVNVDKKKNRSLNKKYQSN